MAISFVNNALGGTTTTTSFSITLPATQAGDIIILEYTHRGTGDATLGGTYGGSWTEKHDQQYATSTFSGKTVWSRATGNHSGETVTGSGLTDSCAAIVTVYRGAHAVGDPLTAATVVGEQNASGNETQAEITTTIDGAWVVLTLAHSPDVGAGSQSCTSPGALTERAEVLSTGGTDTAISHASAEKTTAGATGAFTWSISPNQVGGSWAYAIRPAVPITVDVPLGTLTLTGFAPTVEARADLPRSSLPTRMGPFLPPVRGTGSTRNASPFVLVPDATLTLVGFAPTVATATVVNVPLGTLTLSGFAPTVVTPSTVSVPIGTLVLVGHEPDVTVAAPITPASMLPTRLGPFLPPQRSTGSTRNQSVAGVVEVPLATLTLNAFAPQVIAPQIVQSPAGTLTLVGYEPTVSTSSTPAVVRSSLPTKLGPFLPPRRSTGSTQNYNAALVQVPLGTLTLAGFAPTVSAIVSAARAGQRPGMGPFFFLLKRGTLAAQLTGARVDVPAGTLTLTGFAPTVNIQATIQIPQGTLTLTAFAPAVSAGVTVNVPQATLTLQGFAPTVLANVTVQVPQGTLTLQGFAPQVLAGVTVAVPLATLTLQAFAPSVQTPRNVAVPLGTLTLTAFAPSVIAGTSATVDVPSGELVLRGFAPEVIGSGGPGGGGGGGPEHFMPMSGSIGRRRKRKHDEPAAAPAVLEELREADPAPPAVAAAPQDDAAIERLERFVRETSQTDPLTEQLEAAQEQLRVLVARRAQRSEEEAAAALLLLLLND